MDENFIKLIASVPRLTHEEEKDLAEKILKGDSSAKNKMILANLRLVISIARKYKNNNIQLDDLIQEGALGLIHGIEKFDYKTNNKLGTYVTWWIRQAITQAINDKAHTIRKPMYASVLQKKISKAENMLRTVLGRAPTAKEIADHVNISVERYEQLRTVKSTVVSLDAPFDDNRDLSDTIEDRAAISPEQSVIVKDLRKITDDVVSTLSERELDVLNMRFGIKK